MRQIVVIFTLVLLLTSCRNAIYIYLYNNTAEDFQASSEDSLIKIAPGEVAHLKVGNQFSLCIGKKQYQYLAYKNLPPGEYYGLEHFPLHSIHFQVEGSGVLYLVKPDEKLPSSLDTQPEGFPIKPETPQKCNLTHTSTSP